MDKRFFWVVTGILSLVALAAIAATVLIADAPGLCWFVINPPSLASDFSLTDQTGGTVRLSDFRAKICSALFWIFPLPGSMSGNHGGSHTGAQRVGGAGRQMSRCCSFSTDPSHDTPQSMGAFLARFDPTFIGLTGSMAQLQPIWKDYGVTVLDGGETHSSYTYLIDPNGICG